MNEVKGGVVGNKIEMITVDTAYKVPEAQAAVNRFVLQDKVDMIATWERVKDWLPNLLYKNTRCRQSTIPTLGNIGKTGRLYVSSFR